MIDNRRRNDHRNQEDEIYNRVIEIKRVSKKTKGGNSISFTALMVVGDRQGSVGIALGKGLDVLSAINKGKGRAIKDMFTVPMRGKTIPHDINLKRGAAQVLLKPAPPGSGIIASQSIKLVMEAAGYEDLSVKILGTNNKMANVKALIEALKELKKYDRQN
ncbi:MAG: 30S ribosomal protein S5 [Candidatus Shapirobacteria bacterium]|nr:30S ribosomal protein S5 [Candidatus Shapirobacteria bacterium]